MIVLDFKENSYYAQNVINRSFLGPKSTYLKFCLSLFISEFCMMTGIKKLIKVIVWIFKENSYFVKVKSGKLDIFGPRCEEIQNFHKIGSLDFWKILCYDRESE